MTTSRIAVLLWIVCLLFYADIATAEPETVPADSAPASARVDQRIAVPTSQQAGDSARLQRLEERVTEVRRDELNYQIERDLLKEAYSSRLETINIVIAISLALLAILGFLGVRSVSATRDEFRAELERLRDLRSRSETRLLEIEAEQVKARAKFEELTKTNAEQDQRLRLLELQEKVISLIKDRAFSRALDYIAAGLSTSPRDTTLLRSKSSCYFFLFRISDAIPVLELLREIDPQDTGTVCDLCEAYLLVRDRKSHLELVDQEPRALASKPFLTWYFEAARCYQDGDETRLVAHVRDLLKQLPSQKQRHNRWRYDEIRHELLSDAETKMKTIFLAALSVLEGTTDPAELSSLLDMPVDEA
ncbi:MAG TPA: hypothetical protein VF331_01890 [Polyangiales bacterium]